MFPRYFVPRKADPDPAPTPRGPLLLHVLDTFRLGGRGRSQREVAVVVDRSGALHLVEPGELPPALVAELHHHELARGHGPRLLDVEELWLLSVQLLEQPGDAPGINDPVYLYGRLYGGGSLGAGAQPPIMADGQLALTRADLLEGLVRGAPDAFAIGTTPPSRCLHAVLPADRAEAVEQGRGLVLAWPMVPVELSPLDVGNELLVANLVYDLLVATRADAAANRLEHPLKALTIPVPSRGDLEQDLLSQGWEVRGDVAIRKTESSMGSMLAQLFGPGDKRIELPPEGSVDELLRLAEQILPTFPGFPDRRALAVRARTRRGAMSPSSGSRASGPGGPGGPRIPARSSEPADPPPVYPEPVYPKPVYPKPGRKPQLAPPQKPPPSPPKTDWMEDFVRSHGDRPRITRVDKPRGKPASKEKPSWMKDFEDS